MPRRVALRHNLYLRAASPFNSLETTNHAFHTAILRKHGPAFTGVDAGLLAETLLFYSNVHIVAHRGVLVDLLKTIGPEALIRLIEEKKISLTFLRTDFGTATNTHNGLKFHAFIAYQLGGSQGKKKASREEDVVSCFEFALGESWHTRRLAKRFLKGIVIQQNIDVPGHPKGIPGLALADLDDPQYVQDAIKDFIVSLVPSYQLPMNFHFSIMRGTGDDFLIDHNIDLGTLNQKFARSYPSMNAALTPELLVDQLLEAQAELQLASRYLAESVTNAAMAAVTRRKLAAIVQRRDISLSQIEMFQETQLSNAHAVREAINSGERSFDEFMKILDRAEPFKGWLRSRNPDTALLEEYCKAIAKDSWIGSLPAKIVRFMMASGIGAALDVLYPSGLAAAAGMALGAADTFLLDKLYRGWRPNQFIEGPLQKFVS